MLRLRTPIILLACAMPCCQPTHATSSASDDTSGGLRSTAAEPARAVDASCVQPRLEIKFRDGSGVRLRGGRLVVLQEISSGNVPRAAVEAAIALLSAPPVRGVRRVHEQSEEILDQQRITGQQNSGKVLPDLNLWFFVELEASDAAQVLSRLSENRAIESASCGPTPPPLP
ncbi:MAG: hypothetical protein QM784_09740 [Polyangiaceae bacterium]